jgi:hypothetical protein
MNGASKAPAFRYRSRPTTTLSPKVPTTISIREKQGAYKSIRSRKYNALRERISQYSLLLRVRIARDAVHQIICIVVLYTRLRLCFEKVLHRLLSAKRRAYAL